MVLNAGIDKVRRLRSIDKLCYVDPWSPAGLDRNVAEVRFRLMVVLSMLLGLWLIVAGRVGAAKLFRVGFWILSQIGAQCVFEAVDVGQLALSFGSAR